MICHLIKPKNSRHFHARIKLPTEAKAHTFSLRCTNKQVAQKKLQEAYENREREAAGILAPKGLRDAAQTPLLKHLNDMLSEKAAIRDSRHLAQVKAKLLLLINECGWQFAHQVTAETFSHWRSERARTKGVCAKTLNEYLIAIRSLLNWMISRDRLTHYPLRSIELIPTYGEQKWPRRAFTDDEMVRLLTFSGSRRVIYLLAGLTGLRYGEIAALRRRDLYLEGTSSRVTARARTTKNGKTAIIPLHPDLVEALKEYLKASDGNLDDLLFPSPLFNRKQFPKDLKAAGIAKVNEAGRYASFHSLRHTFCTLLQRAGTGQRTLMELARHSERHLTDHLYTDTALLQTREAVEMLPSFGEKELRHILRQDLVPSSPNESHQVQDGKAFNSPQSLINTNSGHDESSLVSWSLEREMVRDTGIESVQSLLVINYLRK